MYINVIKYGVTSCMIKCQHIMYNKTKDHENIDKYVHTIIKKKLGYFGSNILKDIYLLKLLFFLRIQLNIC